MLTKQEKQTLLKIGIDSKRFMIKTLELQSLCHIEDEILIASNNAKIDTYKWQINWLENRLNNLK